MDWKTIRLLGGIGSILAVAPYANFVGWILVVIALYGISQKTENKKIFNYYIVSVILSVVSVLLIVFGVLSIALITSTFKGEGPANYVGLIIAGIAFILLLIVSAYFVKKSFTEVSAETGIDSFKTAGNLIFWGAVTLPVLVGVVLYFVGYIMQIVSFFSISDDLDLKEPLPPLESKLPKSEN